jgi:thiol-disulfide isomerase/thioredoxin
MLPDFCKTLPVLSYLLILCVSCYSQNSEVLPDEKQEIYNTTIVINLKKNSDRKYLSLGQHNGLFFNPRYVPPPPNTIDTATNLKTVIKVSIDKPVYLSLDFSFFHIEPGDSLNMDFETLVHTKTVYKDTLHINHGNVFFTHRNGGYRYLLNKYLDKTYDSLKTIETADRMAEFLSTESLINMTDSCTPLIYKDHPNLKHDNSTFGIVKKSGADRFSRELIYKIKHLYINTKEESLKATIEKKILNILEYYCMQEDAYDDPMTWGKYEAIYRFFKETDLDAQSILEKFNGCNDTVKQYAMLSLLNDGMLSEEQKLGVIDKLTYPVFREYTIQLDQNPNYGTEKSGYINNAIGGARLFDVNDKELVFEELFKTTDQPYLLLDFSGSWCKPCLDEMSVYAKTGHLDNSKKVRPIWLFFENDKTKWLNIVERYNLKKENCFLVVGESGPLLQKEFALLFDWEGEFPHYFLFDKEGKIINKRAKPLSMFEEKNVSNLPPRENNMKSEPSILPPPLKQ